MLILAEPKKHGATCCEQGASRPCWQGAGVRTGLPYLGCSSGAARGRESGLWIGMGEAGMRLLIGSNRELKPMSLKKEGSRTKSKMSSHRCVAENWGEAGQRKAGIQWRQMHAGGGGILYLPFALTLGKEELATRSNLGTSLVVQLRIHGQCKGQRFNSCWGN